jgi:DNA invertase Pin-like site-specific DNA recombinase
MMGVFAEFERAMIRERVMAGLARARQAGTHLGRKFTEDTKDGSRKIKAALAMRAKGAGYRKIAKEVGLGVGTVMRLTASQELRSRILIIGSLGKRTGLATRGDPAPS